LEQLFDGADLLFGLEFGLAELFDISADFGFFILHLVANLCGFGHFGRYRGIVSGQTVDVDHHF
jgi:hypothetical protein